MAMSIKKYYIYYIFKYIPTVKEHLGTGHLKILIPGGVILCTLEWFMNNLLHEKAKDNHWEHSIFKLFIN